MDVKRRYDIDWLRVIAIGLLLIYHIAIVFQPWGVFIGFIQSDQQWGSLWTPMMMFNVWRIPLLFFVSGMGVGFAMKKRNIKQLLAERSMRILVPYLFGILIIVPVHIFLWQKYYHQDLHYTIKQGHLWFLGNIFVYVLLLSPLFYFLRKHENSKMARAIQFLYKSPFSLLLVMLLFVVEVVLTKPELFELYALSLHGFLLGFLAFFFGFSFILGATTFWPMVLKWRLVFLFLAVALYVVRIVEFQFKAPNCLTSIESNLWVFTVLGFAYRYLNRPGKALRYLSQAVYPVYIIHMIFLYGGSYIILPLNLSAPTKFALLVLFTGAGCFLTYDLIIKRASFLRPLFGLK